MITKAWTAVFAPKDRRPIYAWARDNLSFAPPITFTGPFDVSRSRHFEAILDAFQDDARREINLLKPARGGGTLNADVCVSWTRDQDPGPTLFLLQTETIADDHNYKVLRPAMESVPSIRAMLDALHPHKKTGRKIEFADGNHYHICGPSIGNLQAIGFRYVYEDEVWIWDKGKIGEADGRVGDYLKANTSKIVRISQGGPRPGAVLADDDWARVYGEAEEREWHVACPACGTYQPAVFAAAREDGSFGGLVWDKLKSQTGDWDARKAAKTARWECVTCRQSVKDSAKVKAEWNRTGRYELMTEPHESKVSFRWECIIDFPWQPLVELWLNACNAFHHGDWGPKIQFYQKRRARFMDLETLMKTGLTFTRVNYDATGTQPGEQARFMSIDRQEEDTFWWTVRSWTGVKSRRLGFGKAFSFAECEKIRGEHKVEPNKTFCDSAFAPKGDNGVYTACIRYKWIAVRGDKAHSFTHHITKGKEVRSVQRSYAPLTYGDPGYGVTGQKRLAPLIRFSKPALNQKVQELLDSGDWEEPQDADTDLGREYAAQMSSRFRKTFYSQKTGQSETIWYEGRNDHARDLANQQVLGAVLTKILRDPAAEVQVES